MTFLLVDVTKAYFIYILSTFQFRAKKSLKLSIPHYFQICSHTVVQKCLVGWLVNHFDHFVKY